ncbi:cupin domain-containing protein [Chryseobacterium sp. A301]
MNSSANPTVKLLSTGGSLVLKQMSGNEGEMLPRHSASLESVVYIKTGEILFHMNDKATPLREGESLVVPPETFHQIEVIKDFEALHFMPKEIRFIFE